MNPVLKKLNQINKFGILPVTGEILLRVANLFVEFRSYRILVRPLSGSHTEDLPGGIEATELTEAEAHSLSGNHDYDLDQSFLKAAFAKPDRAFALWQDTHLAHYVFFSTAPTPIEPGLILTLAEKQTYLYKAYSVPKFRGRRLNELGVQLALGKLENPAILCVALVLSTNWPSLHSFRRLGFRPCGNIRILGWKGSLHAWVSNSAHSLGLSVKIT